MDFKYIIIQAGGKGTRLVNLTKNKPKALVPVNNLPLIFHLFKLYEDKKFIIIADYKKEVLINYLNIFASVDFVIVETSEKNTCAGIDKALKLIPSDNPFLLIWSDLLIRERFNFDNLNKSAVGLSDHFECRWSFNGKEFIETPSIKNGVAGCFLFKDKDELSNIPSSGEFVRYLQNEHLDFTTFNLVNGDEVGTIERINKYKSKYICRPFNSIIEQGNKIIKKPITKQGQEIAKDESNWYKQELLKDYKYIPKIYEYSPIILEKVDGFIPYTKEKTFDEKKTILKNIVNALNVLHNLKSTPIDKNSLIENYYSKTIARMMKVKDLIPFVGKNTITVNNLESLNLYNNKNILKDLVHKYLLDTSFCFIHGDCNFSNILIKSNDEPVFIDPRGYFGKTKIFGDIYYDWAKLYYSIVGNYDQFNLKNFTLNIGNDSVTIFCKSNGYEELETYFFSLIPNCNIKTIKLIHAIIWLSLVTYAWEDFDSICGSYYYGIYYLTKFINEVKNG